MSTLKCDHCLLPFSERDALRDTVDGEERVFCCNGCRGIYRLIHCEGLDEFYAKRAGWTPGPPEETEVAADAFLDSVRLSGAEAEIDLTVSGIRCASCVWLIERFLGKVEGITRVAVNYATHKARVGWLPEKISLEDVLKRIAALGYTPRPSNASALEERLKEEKRDLLIRFGTAAFFTMQLMLFTAALYAGYFQGIDPLYQRVFELIALGLSTPVMFYCGHPFLKNTLRGIRNRALNMDTLVFTGSFSAYLYSIVAIVRGGEVYFDTAAMIITLILLGRFIEMGAKARATGAISSLISLQPKEARLLRKAGSSELHAEPSIVPLSSVRKGDILEVLPGDRIPADCAVVEGTSEADEAMLTGESMPQRKDSGGEVISGSMNLNGRLVLEVRKTGEETILAQIIKAVEDAQARKARIQTAADRVVGWFVPLILVIAVATFAGWSLLAGTRSAPIMRAVSVLVIACPCALGLATPLAVLIGSTLLSSKGVLIKGGDVIENIARTDYVAFDKTGTLTMGTPSLLKTVTYEGNEKELRFLAASLERGSEHPIARALRKGLDAGTLLPARDFRAWPGGGVEGVLGGRKTAAGNPAFLISSGVAITDRQSEDYEGLSAGKGTVIGVAVEGCLRGWFVLSDALRKEAAEAVGELHALGIATCLLTGDNRSVGEEIGKKAGIPTIETGVLPVEKAERIRLLRESGRHVIMVGDGINDAPALTEAGVGLAMGSATAIAMESADAVLMRNDLRLVPELIAISKKMLSVIRQNLFWAFSYNLIAIPLAVSGKIHPVISAAFMVTSSLLVVGNSLRLYRFRAK